MNEVIDKLFCVKIKRPDDLIAIPVEEYEHLKECKEKLKSLVAINMQSMLTDIGEQQMQINAAIQNCQIQKLHDCTHVNNIIDL